MTLLSTKQAALRLKVSQRTIQRWLEEGSFFADGDYERIGYHYKVKDIAVEKLKAQFASPA